MCRFDALAVSGIPTLEEVRNLRNQGVVLTGEVSGFMLRVGTYLSSDQSLVPCKGMQLRRKCLSTVRLTILLDPFPVYKNDQAQHGSHVFSVIVLEELRLRFLVLDCEENRWFLACGGPQSCPVCWSVKSDQN
jgi:hypothetical protein